MKERIAYYDIARGMGIIFVVIGHIDTFYGPFRDFIITFHMALFFMISGMLILETGEEERKYSEIIKRKFFRIMIPYALFSILSIAIEFVRLMLQGVYYWPHFEALFISAGSLYGNSVMWFLPALFISELVFLAVRMMKNDFVTILSAFVLAVFAVWANVSDIGEGVFAQNLFDALIRGIYCTIFICIGYYVRKYILPLRMPGYVCGGLAVVLLGVCAILKEINPKVNLQGMYWGEYIFPTNSDAALLSARAAMYLTGAVAGALGIVFLCKLFDKCSSHFVFRVLTFWGSNSLIIMATHLDFHVMHYSMDLAAWFNQFLPNGILYHVWLMVFVFSAESVLISLVNKYVPVLAGKYKK